MRKTKEYKRMRREGGMKARRGNWEEARKSWADATKGYSERLAAKRGKKKTEGA